MKENENQPDYKLFIPFILRWEGGEVNDPDDAGGHTNKGITWGTYKMLCERLLGYKPTKQTFKKMTKKDAAKFIEFYWNKSTGNNSIQHQKIAEAMTSWYWGSGKWGLKLWQAMVNKDFSKQLVIDGLIGKNTVSVVNTIDPDQLFAAAIKERAKTFRGIAKRKPSQKKFLKGWLNRLKDFEKRWS